MEALADFGTVTFLGIPTFTTGIFRTWFGMNDTVTATQMATLFLSIVFIFVFLEQNSRKKIKYSENIKTQSILNYKKTSNKNSFIIILVCILPLLFGFIIPFLQLAYWSIFISNEIIDINFGTCGRYADFFQVEKGILEIINNPIYNNRTNETYLKMKGFNLLSFFGDRIIRSVEELLKKNDIKKTEIDYFIFHQASKLSLDMITKSLEIVEDRVIFDMESTGNLVSASIPIVLKNMLLRNDFKKGQLLVLCGFGVGLSWSTVLCRV